MLTRPSVLLFLLSFLLLAPSSDAAYGRLPMHFEANRGQTDPQVRFVARGAGYAFFITETESVAVLQKNDAAPAVIRMKLIGASNASDVEGAEPFEGKSHYLIGDRSKWRTGVPHFARVRMSEVYEGIDVVYYGNQEELEYDFLVAPGSDPRQIRMRFDGAQRIDSDPSGDLILHIAGGEIRQRAPFVYQQRGGARQPVQAAYRRLSANEFGFDLGAYDPALPLIIDPVLAWSTYLGGSGQDIAYAIAVDATGAAYITGNTTSVDFPTANALQAANAGSFDVFITKLNPAGNALVYSTYLGGSGTDSGRGIAVDAAGNAYVAGHTDSPNFPTVNPIQAANGGSLDAFVAKLNAVGSALIYSTYLGGSSSDIAFGVDADTAGNAYVAGTTESSNFPTANAIQAAHAGFVDGFVTKINAAGSALVYSTYLGGTSGDEASGIAADSAGNAYVAGETSSLNFPTVNALQGAFGGVLDAFVTKINPAGSAFVYSTFLGGSAADDATGIDVDTAGNAYVAGSTLSTNFPTANAVQASNAGTTDVFMSKLNAAGSGLIYSTYLGGTNFDIAFAVAAGPTGTGHATGRTSSTDFPTVNASQPASGGGGDAFVTALSAAGSTIEESTYLGGSQIEEGYGIAVDAAGSMYVAGLTASADFPTVNALQATFAGVLDAFVTKLVEPTADVGIVKAATGAFVVGQNGTFTITVTNAGPIAATGVTVTDTIPAGATFVSATPTQGTCGAPNPVICTLGTINSGASVTITLVVQPTAVGPLSNTATVAATSPDPNPLNDSSTAIAAVGANANLGIVKTATTTPFSQGQNGTFTITVTNAGPTAADAVTVTDILPAAATFVSATPSQGSCSGTATVTCTLGTIANGGSATITLIVQPTAAGPLSNTATVTSTAADADAANNTSTALVQVLPASALATIPALDAKMLLLLAALLAAVAMWMVRR